MRQISHQLSVPTRGKGLYSINRQVADWVGQSGMRQGLLTVFMQHTSASLGRVNANFAPALPRESDGCKARRAGKGNPLPSGATPQTRFLAATRRDGAVSGACLCREPLALPALHHDSLRGLHPESAPPQE